MGVRELLQAILSNTGLNRKELASYFSVTESLLRKWQNHTAVPSKNQMLSILHFASLMGVDTSLFTWEKYIELVLSVVYNDDYRIGKGIDENRFMVHLYGIDGSEGYVPIEEISNRKKNLFSNMQ